MRSTIGLRGLGARLPGLTYAVLAPIWGTGGPSKLQSPWGQWGRGRRRVRKGALSVHKALSAEMLRVDGAIWTTNQWCGSKSPFWPARHMCKK